MSTKNAVEASGTTSRHFLDTCLDYSLTIYVMQRTADVVDFADPNQPECHADRHT